MMSIVQKRFQLVAWIFFLLSWSSQAQLPPLKFITYTTNDDLLHNHTKKCIQDQYGFLWVVSETGLSRFDGVSFEHFQHTSEDSTSLPSNTIHDIALDDQGRIWLGTDVGLCYYSYAKDGFISVNITGSYQNSTAVQGIAFDKLNHGLWFMTDKALYKCDGFTLKISHTSCRNTSEEPINHLYVSSDNRVWVALYRNGVLVYDVQRNQTSALLEGAWVTCFYEGKDKKMWIGHWHSEQLGVMDMKTHDFQFWRDKNEQGFEQNVIITSITTSPYLGDSLLLLSTLHMGIRVFNILQQKFMGGYSRDLFVKYSLPGDFINSLFSDDRGILWACTWNGLSKMNGMEQQFRTVEIPFLNTPMFQRFNLVEGIVSADDHHDWWLGINGCGLIRYDPVKKEVVQKLLGDFQNTEVFFEPGNSVEFIFKSDDGTIWAGNDHGLVQVRNNKLKQFEIRINGQYQWRKNFTLSPDGTFWITTRTHLIHFDPATEEYSIHQIDPKLQDPLPIRSMVECAFCKGTLWCGTANGLFEINPIEFASRPIVLQNKKESNAASPSIHSLVTDGKDRLYLGTSRGLGIYDIRKREYELIGEDKGIFPILYKSMLLDKAGNVWIYTPHALYRYNPLKNDFTEFTTSDGIHNFSSDLSHLFSFQNNFYIGYRGAYTEFDPLKVDRNLHLSEPRITQLWIEGKRQRIPMDSFKQVPYHIPAGSKDIAFHYTGIDYTNSGRITFQYQMDNDIGWKDAGRNRMVSYNRLTPGLHTFRLRAINSSGILNEQEAAFQFYLAPSLWQRVWFWPALAVLFVGVVIRIASKRVKRIRKEEALKTASNKMMAQLETRLLRSQMNPHFIFNSLNSIQKYIWENKEEDAAEYLSRFAKLIRAILENSRMEFITLREELDVLKLYVDLEHRRSNGKFDYSVRTENGINLDEILIPPLLLQPYIENAIWHGVNKKQSQGHIDIHISLSGDMLLCTIDDDGVGRNVNQTGHGDTEMKKTPVGTNITLQRLQQLQTQSYSGGVQVIDKTENGKATGTTVILSIPAKFQMHA